MIRSRKAALPAIFPARHTQYTYLFRIYCENTLLKFAPRAKKTTPASIFRTACEKQFNLFAYIAKKEPFFVFHSHYMRNFF
jgi:hypothetical protein